MSDHDWRFIFSTGQDAPGKSLDTLHYCIRCGALRHDYSHNGGQKSPNYPVYHAVGYEGALRQEPTCGNSLMTEIEVLDHEVSTLRRGWVKAHRHACTKDNCVLDGGPEHEEAFR